MTKTLSVRIDEDLVRSFESTARATRLGRSEAVREALEQWIRRRRLEDKIRREVEGYTRHPVTADEFGPVLEAQSCLK